ncbi:MAG: hypothetical protein AWM53_02052 [Candidatus Dichloromethanomonas elyunquensis]|nr:MAG: hypothetical protein AWM53_02052 [Candidatus Dichloromethanomonas elyunquensis]
MITRGEAYTELKKYVTNKNLIKHMISVEAVMRGEGLELEQVLPNYALPVA